ncbi:MAG: alpha/beta fold hydrolase [Candidatus Daviesbacteria bacterium]|nr:MAG: alpha/beta fold hydrolase [Candidatus Daviesbacteria bacterium]
MKQTIVLALLGLLIFLFLSAKLNQSNLVTTVSQINVTKDALAIEEMRQKSYPGSDLKIEQTLDDGGNYHQYIASYQSEGLKIYGLLTVPLGEKPNDGWPAILFNHGYIPPAQYQTTEKYVDYVNAFASNSYIVFKSDYRGHGQSQGEPSGAYYSPAYTVDVLNALSSLKKFPDANPNKIGMWGHSLGGNITLRSLVISSADIKAAVIWNGVVGTYDDLMNNWRRRVTYSPPPNQLALRSLHRNNLIKKYGSLADNPNFWHSIDPNYYIQDIAAPVQLHAGLSDEEVPWQFSEGLYNRLKEAKKEVKFYTYLEADHNLSQPFSVAIQRSIDFFDQYLKGGE